MGIDFAAKNVELNGGSVYIYKIPDSVIATPSTYAAPSVVTNVADWDYTSPTSVSYVSMGATDGNTMSIKLEQINVRCDQTASDLLNGMAATGGTITCVAEEHLIWRLGIALGLDFADSGDVTTGTVFSPLLNASATRNIAYFGDLRGNTFFDVVFEKYRTSNKTKIQGWRLPKAQCTTGPEFVYKHDETDFYEIVFTGVVFDLDSTAAYYNEVVTGYNDTV